MQILNLLDQGPQPYSDVDRLQREIHADIVANHRDATLILSEMQSVYTAGKRTGRADIVDPHLQVVPVDRGGRITWHGPGQIVAYPIIPLACPIDVKAYACALEGAVIDTAAAFGILCDRVAGRSGVWLHEPERKICAIGVRVQRGVTLHGLAFNITNSLAPYHRIVPCGISDAGVSTLATETPGVTIAQVAPILIDQLTARLQPLCAVRSPQLKESS